MNKVRDYIFGLVALSSLLLSSGTLGAADETAKVVRMGNQKVGAYALLKARGVLEARLKPLGYTVSWKEFSSGPLLLEGLKVGAVDFGHGGEAPPIFAQAAGAQFFYIGHEPPAPKGEAILVPKDSPLKTIADLKGKKIALNKGSNVHYLLVCALEKAGLKYADVDVVYLSPADGRAAFDKGAVDAWVIWEPYRTVAEQSGGARTLADGGGLVLNHEFFFVTKAFAELNPQVIEVVLRAARDAYADAAKDIPGTAKAFSAATGFPPQVMEVALSRRGFGVQPMTPDVIAEQQKIADTFKALGLIPTAIQVADVVRKP